MRTFIAIKVEPEVLLLQAIADLKQELKDESLKWVDQRKLHLTLKFLGETSEAQVRQIKSNLEKLASQYPSTSFLPAGMGYFKSKGMPRVLFVNIKNDDALKQLAAAVDVFLTPLGFKKESRPYNPHLTLARIKFLKNKMAFYEAVGRYNNLKLQPVTVGEIFFFQSHLNAEGPVYYELAKYSLSGNA